MMFTPHDSLVLPFLDHEFQTVSRIPPPLVTDYCHCALVASPRVIASPSFFIESNISRDLFLTSPEFYGTEHVAISLRDSTWDQYIQRKRNKYASLEKQYKGYFTVADEVLSKLRLPIRQRNVQIGEAISNLWQQNISFEGVFSFRHMTNSIPSSAQKAVLEALAAVPSEIRSSPFVWQNVCTVLDKYSPNWRLVPEFERSLRNYLLKCYFECLCEPRDSIVAFSDFLYLEVADNALLPPSIPLAPMRLFLMVTELMKSIRRMDVEELLGIINSSACHEFRARYQEIVSVVRSEISESPNVDGLLRLPYARAVEWCNVSSKTILRLCHMAGSDAMNRRRNWTLGALLDDTAARGFVDYAKRTAAFARVQQKLLQEKWEIMPLTSQHTNVQIVIMRDINKANVVIMGPDAHGNVVNQSVVQDQHDINLTMLAEELAQLRLAMKREATTSEHDTAIERIASAETEAKTGNLEKTVGFLKLAGQWALDQAIKNGAAAATAALQKALG